jgi:hypothetical protein
MHNFNDDKVCSCVPGWFGSEFRAFLCETDADDASCVRWCALEFTTAGTSEGQRISWRLIVDIVADPLLRDSTTTFDFRSISPLASLTPLPPSTLRVLTESFTLEQSVSSLDCR